jgi:hypothetical protein
VKALFEMQVKDTLRLGEHMTAFVGPIESELKFIRACDCDIVVDGQVKGSIRIDGEMVRRDNNLWVERQRCIALFRVASASIWM